ncbi:MAG: hypothetical protein A2252_08155 [Elusimicrobia bacterium RIFOXYA2_FULL_39_19]|nr:MAG: hypothetical protein A2252_08155 [Elusimicrobia bacterium RIFOXYA2_FULL_39_19]
MRLSDILKKKSVQNKSTEDLTPQEVSELEPEEIVEEKTEEPQLDKVQFVQEIHRVDSAEKVYTEGIDTQRKFLLNIEKNKVDINPLLNVARKIIALIVANNDELIAMCRYTTPDLYLHSHSVNTAILSTALGFAYGYSSEQLEKLTISAFLHDIGMLKVVELAAKQGKVNGSEFSEIKKHTMYNKQLLENVIMSPQTKTAVSVIISQVHERRDGAGYPKGLSGEEIDIMSKIISVADVFEAFTHPRSWRESILSHDALKKMIDMADMNFDMNLVKLFIEKVSLYPIGSYVRVNTDEIARVVGSNPGLPTRPKLKIVIDSENKRVPTEKLVDLSKNSVIYITEAVDETKLKLEDKKLALELKARRWWVKTI